MNFIIKSNEIYNNKYDYSKVEYINNHTKVKIMCPIHGEFQQRPLDHMKGHGCKQCGIIQRSEKRKITKEFFINVSSKYHNNKYDYSKVEYKNIDTKVKIICPIHGEFEQRPYNHMKGEGCIYCSNENKKFRFKLINKKNNLTLEEFIEKANFIHKNEYDYSKVIYKNMHEKIIIICKKHGEFEQLPHNHLQPNKCPKCNYSGISEIEKELLSFIKENYNLKIENNNRNIISNELDIYLPDLKLAFEFNGLYWHSELYKDKNYHSNKTQECEEQGIHLVHIYEDDWLYKQDIVKSRILNLLGKSEKIMARKCEIRTVNNNISRDFLCKNHIQLNVFGKINFGLFYNNELVSLMTFGELRKCLGTESKEGSFELLRFCNKLNTSVIGGANKLFAYFIKQYKPKDVISYADRSWTMNNGNTIYDKLGFKLDSITKPNYYYIEKLKRKNRFNFRKSELIKEGFDKNKSEHEIMLDRQIYRIYNSGNLKFKVSF